MYVPSADSPRFQEENHAVQTQIQTAGTNWQEELVKTGDPPATHPGQQVFADALESLGAGTDINMTWDTLEAKFPESAKVLKNFDLEAPPSTEKARGIAKALVGCILQTQVNASTESAFLGRTSTDENTKFLVIALLPKFKNCPLDVVFSELEQLLKLVNTTEDEPWETKTTPGDATRSDDNGTASINQTAAMGTLIAERVQTVITTSV